MKMVAQEDVTRKDAIENENRCTHGLISILFSNERLINLISIDLDKHQEQEIFFCWEMLWSVVDQLTPPVDQKRNLDYSMTQRVQTGNLKNVKNKIRDQFMPSIKGKKTQKQEFYSNWPNLLSVIIPAHLLAIDITYRNFIG